jgi:predicted nucleotidyltransferase
VKYKEVTAYDEHRRRIGHEGNLGGSIDIVVVTVEATVAIQNPQRWPVIQKEIGSVVEVLSDNASLATPKLR